MLPDNFRTGREGPIGEAQRVISKWNERTVMAESPLTLELITGRPAPAGTAPAELRWSPDGRHLAFLWDDTGMGVREIWLVEREEITPVCLTRAWEEVREAGGVSDLVWSPWSDAVVFLCGGEVWEVGAPGGTPRRLTSPVAASSVGEEASGSERTELGISPDGRLISFLEDGDLWFLPWAGGLPERVTAIGRPAVGDVPLGTYYRRDVEIGPATWGGPPSYAWSPDGRHLAVHVVDRRQVPTMSLPYYLSEAPVMNVLRRGRPGDVNESRTIGLYDVEEDSLCLLDLPAATATRIVSFAWSPSGILLIDRETDDAVDRHLLLADPRTGHFTEIWHDHRESRIYNDIASAWHDDGRRILVSGDLDDRYRLYLFDPSVAPRDGDTHGGARSDVHRDARDGAHLAVLGESFSPDLVFCAGSVRVLTPDSFDVTGPGIPVERPGPAVPGAGDILYVSSEPSPYERHVWRTDELGTTRVRLTTRPGVHTPFLSPDGHTLALLSTDDVTAPELYLTDAAVPADPRRITHSRPSQFDTVTWQAARYVSFPHRSDRFAVHARIIDPPYLNRSRKHPVIFGNMYSNTVRNRWEPRFAALQQYLAAELGYIVVQVDVRGSTGYGRDFREAFLMDWGGGDLEDIHSAVDYVKTLPYVDGDRLGVWGTSYGGTLTIYSLLRKPALFRAGVAAAPAVDPHFFGSDDVAICRRPQTHPETFARGALQYAVNLRDHLLIIHGMQDDVVPFQTSMVLAEELMRLGKDFEVALAPAATHAWSQRSDYALYLMRRLVGHFERYLKD